MKKIFIIISLILILALGYNGYHLYVKYNKINNLKDEISSREKVDEEYVTLLDSITKEVGSFDKNEKSLDFCSNLGFLVILDAVHNYNDGGNYEAAKGENFIGNTSNRQLFVMQQILKDENNNSNFIILDSEGKDSNEKMSPSDEYVMAYYPYDLFNQEYKKYFSDNFDIDNRVVSSLNTKYDKDKKYVYYENKKIGLNGINVTSMDITSISYDSSSKIYTSSVKINYSDRARELMKIDSSNGIIKYTRSNNNLYLESFEINK